MNSKSYSTHVNGNWSQRCLQIKKKKNCIEFVIYLFLFQLSDKIEMHG